MIKTQIQFSSKRNPMKLLAFVALFLAISPNIYAGENSAQKVLSPSELKEIQKKTQKSPHLSMLFKQTTYRSLRKRSSISHGSAYFSQPKSFRWALLSPKKSEWIYDGTNLYNYFPDKNNAVAHNSAVSKGKELRQLVDMVINFESLTETFKLVSARKNGPIISIALEPKAIGEIKSALITLDEPSSAFKSIRLNFASNNYSLFEFSKLDHKLIPPSQYKVPEGTRISSPLL